AIFSPTTGETLPGRRAAYAPEAETEEQSAAPDRKEQEDEARHQPERDRMLRLRPLRGQREDPTDREQTANAEHDPGPPEAEDPKEEWQHARDDGDQKAGHDRLIGSQVARAESTASSQTPSASSSCASVMTNGTRTRM